MAWELREGSCFLFKNDKKTQDNHPSARGELLLGGVVYEVSAWTKEGKKGKYQSLSFKSKGERTEAPRTAPSKPADDFSDMDDGPAF